MSLSTAAQISSRDFYQEYSGHRVQHLRLLLPLLRQQAKSVIWTAGDSSLDNKYWFHDRVRAVKGVYAQILNPPQSKPDITYWINQLLLDAMEAERMDCHIERETVNQGCEQQQRQQRWVAINTAVEASTLNERTFRLRSQDIFLRDNLQIDDVLVVSVGGNDVALAPSPCTIASILCLLHCLPTSCLEYGYTWGTVPCDDCCYGCGPSLCSCACACPPCLGYFRHLFGTRLEKYIHQLTAKTKPSRILVCMIYYPEESPSPAWAGPALRALGYDQRPDKLQLFIRKMFLQIASHIRVADVPIIPVPLFDALDSKNPDDYVQRVEPSPTGGRKVAEFLLDHLHQQQPQQQSIQQRINDNDDTGGIDSDAPMPYRIQDR